MDKVTGGSSNNGGVGSRKSDGRQEVVAVGKKNRYHLQLSPLSDFCIRSLSEHR